MTTSPRPFKNDYAGTWCGHCSTRESAIVAAVKHMLINMDTSCTITNTDTGEDIARLRRHNNNKGVDIQAVKPLPIKPKLVYKRKLIKAKPKARRAA